jgi:hypothetical protein
VASGRFILAGNDMSTKRRKPTVIKFSDETIKAAQEAFRATEIPLPSWRAVASVFEAAANAQTDAELPSLDDVRGILAYGATSSKAISHTTVPKSPTTSTTSLRSEIQGDDTLSLRIRIYFQERLRQRLYDMVMKEFDVYKARGGNKAKLARRLDKRPEQITRWLSEPENLTFDTLSDLLLGLSGAELAMLLEYPADQPTRAPRLPERLLREKSISKTTTFSVSVLDKESEQANTRDCVEAGETAATDRMTEADLATKLWDAWACGRDDNDGWRKVARFVRGMGQPLKAREANARAERAEAAVEAARRIIEASLLAETENAYGRGCDEKSRQIAEAMGMTITPARELTVTWEKTL